MSYCQGCADREARIAALEADLAQERARGAVVKLALESYVPRGVGCWPTCGACDDGTSEMPRECRARAALQGDSPAVQALLELAEAAVEPQDAGVDGILPGRQRIWVSRRLAAALERWKEVHHG